MKKFLYIYNLHSDKIWCTGMIVHHIDRETSFAAYDLLSRESTRVWNGVYF